MSLLMVFLSYIFSRGKQAVLSLTSWLSSYHICTVLVPGTSLYINAESNASMYAHYLIKVERHTNRQKTIN